MQKPSGELQNPTADEDKAYFVNISNVSPVIEQVQDEGSDDFGYVPEQTICAYAESIEMMDRSGSISEHPITNGRTKNNRLEVQVYKLGLIQDLIAAGKIPVSACPYGPSEFKPSGPIVKVPVGVKPCKGEPGGCVHFKELRATRQARALKNWEEMQNNGDMVSMKNVEKLQAFFGGSKVDPATLKANMVKNS
jgi:hypothetical protein